MKQDRFLMGILIGILVLVVAAVGLFFSRQQTMNYRNDDSPEAVVFNYVLAVTERDYQKAYGYLADLPNKPDYDSFRQSFFNGMVSPNNVGVDVGEAHIDGDEATVEVSMVYPSSDPFSQGYNNVERALLVRQNGVWKLSSMPYNFWDYNWYQQQPVKR
jgi:Tfp pilus assembly protein PilW